MLTNTKTNIFKFKCKPLHVTIWFNVGLVGLHNDCGGRRWLESSQKRFLTFPPLLQPTGFAEFDCTCNYSEFEFISSSSNTNTKEVFDLWFAFATSRLCGFPWIVWISFSDSVQTWTIEYDRHWHGQGEEGKVSFLTSVSRPVNIGAAALSVNRPCQCCVGVDNGNDDIGSDQGNCPFYFPDCVVTTTKTMT